MISSLSILKTGAAALALAGALLTSDLPANALSLNFKPTGTSLDPDRSRDIRTSVGSTIDFQLLLETAGLAEDEVLEQIEYSIEFDTSELQFQEFTNVAFGDFDLDEGSGSLGILQFDGSIAPDKFNKLVGQVRFKVLSGLVNDGRSDFTLRFTKAIGSGDPDANLIGTQVQRVEVQPIPTPALLPGLVGLGISFWRRNSKNQLAAP